MDREYIDLDNPATEKLPQGEIFAARLSEAMARSNLSGKEIAAAAGIDAGYLSNLKKGKRPPPSAPVTKSLAAALGVSEDWLASGEGPVYAASRVAGAIGFYGAQKELSGTRLIDRDSNVGTPLMVISEIRAEIIDCIERGGPPSPRLLALIGEIEAVLVEMKARSN